MSRLFCWYISQAIRYTASAENEQAALATLSAEQRKVATQHAEFCVELDHEQQAHWPSGELKKLHEKKRGYPHGQMITALHLEFIEPELRPRRMGYAYIVTTHALPHVAFHTFEGLAEWLELRGLKLQHEVPPNGTTRETIVLGAYREAAHADYVQFFGLTTDAVHVREVTNGAWTLGLITTDEDGVRTVHTLNPNCRYRPKFDPAICRARQLEGRTRIDHTKPEFMEP